MTSQRKSTVCQLLLSLELGGAEVLAARIAHRLRGDFRFVFICLDAIGRLGEGLRDEGFPVHVLDRQPGVDWGAIHRLKALTRREGVDLVHAHQYGPFFYGAMARLPFGDPPVLMTEHGRHFPDRALRSHFVANRLLLGRRDRLMAVGEHVRIALIDNEGFPSTRVRVLHNGIDTAALAKVTDHRADVRQELGIDAGVYVILQAARLQPIKDHATAIRAMARVVTTDGAVRLLLAGAGPQASEIDSLIKGLGLVNHVCRLGLRTDVHRLLGAADAALLSSVSEGIPLSLIEAMAAGLPVVSTRVGGVPEVVEEGRSGLLVPAGDDDALAQRILRLARNPALGQQLGQAGRERAQALFSEERMIAEYARIYREMTEKNSGNRRTTYLRWSEPACRGA
jgi:glycosyltransferase involved in cell wall biosynthesis